MVKTVVVEHLAHFRCMTRQDMTDGSLERNQFQNQSKRPKYSDKTSQDKQHNNKHAHTHITAVTYITERSTTAYHTTRHTHWSFDVGSF